MPVELRFLRLFLLLTVAGPKLIDNYLAKGRFRGEDRTDALQRAFKDLITHNIARLEQGGSDSDDAVQLEELLRINQLLIVHQKSLSSQLVAALRPATTIDYLCLGAACLGGLSLLGWSLWGVIDAHATAIRLNVTHAELQSAQFWQAMPEAARTVNFYRFGSMFGVDCPKVSMGEFELGRGGALRGARAVADVQAGEPLCSISRHAILSWSMAEKAMRILSTAGNVAEHSLLVAWLLRERARARSPHMPYVQACLELAIVEAGSVPWTWEAADPRTERLSAVARQLRQRTRAHAEGDYAAIFGNGRMERFANELSQGVCAPAPCTATRLEVVYALEDFLRLFAVVKARTFRAFKHWPVFAAAGAVLIPGVDMLNHALSDAERAGPLAGGLVVGYSGVTVTATKPVQLGAQIFAGEWYGTASGEQACAEVFYNTYGFENPLLSPCPRTDVQPRNEA